MSEEKQTLFQEIAASPETLAPHLMYSFTVMGGLQRVYSSRLYDKVYHRRGDALRAIIKKLNEVKK